MPDDPEVPVHPPRPFVVQQSFPDPRPTTNPYLVMLRRALAEQPGVQVQTFTWRRALLGRYDVFHVHWPEILVDGRTPARKLVRQLLTAALLARLRLQGIPLVRTRHNLELPSGIGRRERALLQLVERATTGVVVLNADTPRDGRPTALVPHGHYRDWYSRFPRPEPVPGRLAFVGLVRRYKGVETLLDVFSRLPDPALTLRVAGQPSSDELAAVVSAAAAADPRVSTHLAFLDEAELVTEVGAAELVVLPYREMHNSGGALTALSLDRPVLVPDNAVTRALAAEVGPGWVVTYPGELTTDDVVRALAEVRARPAGGRPDLSARDWDRTGAEHVAAYRDAGIRRRTSPAAPPGPAPAP
jgi:glycosyltransferase involved in cell wall biosynthesis